MYFQAKNSLKNNLYYNINQALKYASLEWHLVNLYKHIVTAFVSHQLLCLRWNKHNNIFGNKPNCVLYCGGH